MAALALPAPVLAQQTERDIKVSSIAFEGNQTFAAGVLTTVIQTRKASWWPWSRFQPFDQRRLDADVSRLRAFYHDRGFPEARVRLGDVTVSPSGESVSLRFVIEEGPPLLIQTVVVEGLEGLPPAITEPAANLPLKPGDRRDNALLLAARNELIAILREQGHPHVSVEIQERAPQPDASGTNGAPAGVQEGVHLAIVVTPGPETRFGPLVMNGLETLKRARRRCAAHRHRRPSAHAGESHARIEEDSRCRCQAHSRRAARGAARA
jgi:outer membrane protein assembly factor BamA